MIKVKFTTEWTQNIHCNTRNKQGSLKKVIWNFLPKLIQWNLADLINHFHFELFSERLGNLGMIKVSQ